MKGRLQKIMARCGCGSRRTCEHLIATGCVKVNGRVVCQQGMCADSLRDVITVRGKRIEPQGLRTLLFYKPKGVITTLHDPQGRPTVADFFSSLQERLYPVGRLDVDTEGLLLMSNDGALTQRILHPRYRCPKVYHVTVSHPPARAALRRLAQGIWLEDGKTAPADVFVHSVDSTGICLRLTLYEGRKRQIRRMCAAIGHPVLKLMRVQIGFLRARGLGVGRYRELTDLEIRWLKGLLD